MSSTSQPDSNKRALDETANTTATTVTANKRARSASTRRIAVGGWGGGLPAELFVSISRFLPTFRFLFTLSRVNRRLFRLVQGTVADGAQHAAGSASSSFAVGLAWRHLPLVRVRVASDEVQVQVPAEQLSASMNFRIVEMVPMMNSLHNVCAFELIGMADEQWGMVDQLLLPAGLEPLRDFTQLVSLTVAVDGILHDDWEPSGTTTVDPLIAALHSLRHLRAFELHEPDRLICDTLLTTLRRLCSGQLEHVGLSDGWVRRLAGQGVVPLSSIRSFKYTNRTPIVHMAQSPYTSHGFAYASLSYLAVFPSLTHVYLASNRVSPAMLSRLPAVASIRLNLDLLSSTRGTMPAMPVQSLSVSGALRTMGERKRLRVLLSRMPAIQQLAITPKVEWHQRPKKADVFTSLHPYTHITYLQIDGALFPADWRFLLTPASPPVFAASLKQLLLRSHLQDRGAVVVLLPSLPSMFPSLTHCHIGLEFGTSADARLSYEPWERARLKWNAELPVLKAALGSVWCEEAADVIAQRADVAWQRAVSIQLDGDADMKPGEAGRW